MGTERDWKDGPHRRHHWVLDVEAHDVRDLIVALRSILFTVESEERFPVIVSGGGWFTRHEEDPGMTKERFEADLEEWCENRRREEEAQRA